MEWGGRSTINVNLMASMAVYWPLTYEIGTDSEEFLGNYFYELSHGHPVLLDCPIVLWGPCDPEPYPICLELVLD